MTRILKRIVAVCAGVGFALAAHSQSFPQRPIRIVTQFTGGSGSDSVARILGQQLVESLKQPVLVENRPGANGVIAAQFVAKSAPDGYTLFITSNTTHSANPSLMKSLPYDPVKDFAPVTRLGNFFPTILAVDPRLPINTPAELIAYAKANPGKLSYASGNTSSLISGATFARMTGIDLLHVPYKGTPPAMTDVVGGQVSMMFIDFVGGMNHVRSGRLRPLAVVGDKSIGILPNVPPLSRTPGMEGYNLIAWLGVFAPAGTPPDIVDTLNREFVRILARKDIIERFAGLGFDAFGSTPQELGAFVAAELTRWAKLVKDAGIQPE